jgi:hypothetical protein
MRIKNKFLNEESLKSYGFKKEPSWFIYKTPYCDIVIIKDTGEIQLWCEDAACIDNIIYHLVIDGLVEI